MDHIAKVFCTGTEQAALAKANKTLEKYPAFLLIQGPPEALSELARKYPVEDITDQYTIRTPDRSIDTAHPRVGVAGKRHKHPAYGDVKPLSAGKHHYLVQFAGPIKSAWLKSVKQAGGEPRVPYENFTYVVRANDKQVAKIAALPFVRWAGHLPHRARLSPSVANVLDGKRDTTLPRTRKLENVFTVQFFGADDLRPGVAAIKKLGLKVLTQNAKTGVAIVDAEGTKPKQFEQLAAVHGVRAIRSRSFKRPSNDVAAGLMGAAGNPSPSIPGLSGKGETIGVCDTGLDTGDPSHIHPDFTGRVAWIKSYPITPDLNQYIKNPGGNDGAADLDSGHGTHVAGSALGDGSASQGLTGVNGAIRGLAHKAKLVFQAVEQELDWKNPADLQRYGRYLLVGLPTDLGVLFADAYRKGVRIHSNSWGGGDPGEYDEQCEQLDRFVWQRKTFCVVVAAGNDGTDKDGDGAINPMSVTSPGTAKNCITVGASENTRTNFNTETYGKWWPSDYPAAPHHNDPMANDGAQVVAFSSRGPTRDGRIKPDVVAPGTFILSTRSTQIAANNRAWAAFPPSKHYFHMGGTSMSTPLVAGAVALIREHLRTQKRLRSPSAALLKATLIVGSQRLAGYASAGALLDNHQGFGRVNLDTVLAPAKPATTVFHDVSRGLKTGEAQTFVLEVKSNQVPLRIVLAYSDYPGPTLVNNLNLIVTDPNGKYYLGNQDAGGTQLDTKNNVEAVNVSQPIIGNWKVEIVGSNVPHGPQPFALVALGHLT